MKGKNLFLPSFSGKMGREKIREGLGTLLKSRGVEGG